MMKSYIPNNEFPITTTTTTTSAIVTTTTTTTSRAVLSSEAHEARASGPRPKRGPAQDGVTLFFNSFF